MNQVSEENGPQQTFPQIVKKLLNRKLSQKFIKSLEAWEFLQKNNKAFA